MIYNVNNTGLTATYYNKQKKRIPLSIRFYIFLVISIKVSSIKLF